MKKAKPKRNLVKLAADQGIQPYDPSEKPDWEVPTGEECERYLDAMKKKPRSGVEEK